MGGVTMNNRDQTPIKLINHTVMSVLQHSVATCDERTLMILGVNPESIKELEKLAHGGAQHLGRTIAPIVQIDNQALNLNIQHSINSSKEYEFIVQIILADAPFSVLNLNYGMKQKEFNERRKKLGMESTKRGRPREPELDRAPQALIRTLEEYILDTNNCDIQENTDLLISLSDTYKLGIREILGYHALLKKEIL